MEVWALATAMLLAPAPVRTAIVNVRGAGPAVAATRAVEETVSKKGGRLRPVDLPDDAHGLLVQPFDPAADQAPARSLLELGRQRYADLAYERAAEALTDAEAEARHAAPSASLWTLLTDIHVASGVVHTARGATARAVAAFRVAQALAPNLALEAAYYPPAVRAQFRRAASTARKTGHLEIAEPQGALVTIDGRPAGAAPLERDLPEGEHYVALELPAHEPRIERVPISASRSTRLALPLAKRPVLDQVRALLAAARERGSLEPADARALGLLLGADLVLAVDETRVRPYWATQKPGPAGETPPILPIRQGKVVLEPLLAALPAPEPFPTTLPVSLGRTPPPPHAQERKSWYTKWWVWAIGGAVVAGTAAAAAAGVFTTRQDRFYFPQQ